MDSSILAVLALVFMVPPLLAAVIGLFLVDSKKD